MKTAAMTYSKMAEILAEKINAAEERFGPDLTDKQREHVAALFMASLAGISESRGEPEFTAQYERLFPPMDGEVA